MAVIMFSRVFPAYHPKKGQPTYFVEKFIKSWDSSHNFKEVAASPFGIAKYIDGDFFVNNDFEPKHHTIRSGHRWEEGDMFSPRIWTGKPYNSKQFQFALDTRIEKVWDITIRGYEIRINGNILDREAHFQLSKNDGLDVNDLKDWFKIPCQFDGQIICWNKEIEY